MKVKTSITLSEDLLESIDALGEGYQSRSDLIEKALRYYMEKRMQKLREEKDLKILNEKAAALNQEAEDVLSYQVEL